MVIPFCYQTCDTLPPCSSGHARTPVGPRAGRLEIQSMSEIMPNDSSKLVPPGLLDPGVRGKTGTVPFTSGPEHLHSGQIRLGGLAKVPGDSITPARGRAEALMTCRHFIHKVRLHSCLALPSSQPPHPHTSPLASDPKCL